MKRLARIYTTTALLLLNTLLLLALVEGCSTLILALRGTPTLAQEIETFKAGMLRLSYYAAQDWSRAYWDEHMDAVDHLTYQPFALWRTRPYAGEYINVDANGRRAVTGAACAEGQYRIYTFGGSAMWGYGVPDHLTIPAQIASILRDRGVDVCVINHAEIGYTSTQSLIALQQVIQAGDVPEMVIFYDGSNDVSTANRTSLAGTHFYYPQIEDRLGGTVSGLDAQENATLTDLLRGTATYRLIAPRPAQPDTWAQPPFEAGFVDGVVNTYLANVQTAEAMAREYGFAFYAFVQPTLAVADREPVGEEQQFLWDMPGGLADLFRETYPRWREAADASDADALVYYGNALDDMTDLPVWIDFNHLTQWGNLAMATNIAEVIAPVIEREEE